jgi:hypothetical protein
MRDYVEMGIIAAFVAAIVLFLIKATYSAS